MHRHFHAVITTIAHKYRLPGLFYMDLWPLGPEQLIIADPVFANEYVTSRKLPKHELQAAFLDPILGSGNLVSSNGTHWKRPHDMIAPAFSTANTFAMLTLIAEEVMTFHTALGEKAQSSQPISLEHMISSLAFDIISRFIFGVSGNAQRGECTEHGNLNTIIQREFAIRNTWSPLTKRHLKRDKHAATASLNSSITSKLHARFLEIQRIGTDLDRKQGLSIVDLLLRSQTYEITSGSESASDEFTATATTSIKTLFLAGSGTTSDTLCFAFMLLSTHPAVVSKLRAEHARVFAPDIETTHALLKAEPQRLKKLDYTTCVIKETLRMYPIGNTGRTVESPDTKTITYQGKTYPINAKTIICPVQHTWQMSADIYPDPDSFNPDRFLDMDKTGTIAWRPFERGNRACIGQALAMEEMKTILLYTVQFFDLECHGLKPNKAPRVPWTKMDTVFGDRAFQEFLTEARPRDGMPMTVRKVEGK